MVPENRPPSMRSPAAVEAGRGEWPRISAFMYVQAGVLVGLTSLEGLIDT